METPKKIYTTTTSNVPNYHMTCSNNEVKENIEYIKPVTESFPMILEDFITNSPENHSSYIDDGNDDWEDPGDPGEEIDW